MELKNVTLVSVSSIRIDQTIEALKKSMNEIDFGEVLLISHEKPENLPDNINFKKCRQLNSIDAYNWFMIFELRKYIETDFVLVIQHDGYILDVNRWNDIFLNYDYIGAPWPENCFFDSIRKEVRVGNGGFSLRSKKLLNAFNELNLKFDNDKTSFPSEDAVICVYKRKELEEFGIKFAPLEVASIFSSEFDYDVKNPKTFGFHFHPLNDVKLEKSFLKNLIYNSKLIIKKIIPRYIVNKVKAFFLEDIRKGLS